jgi:hypothetical protein
VTAGGGGEEPVAERHVSQSQHRQSRPVPLELNPWSNEP